jgi:drug/metabolite transporter (DMT)-like permease
VYGWTFVLVKQVLAVYPVLPFLGLRFGLAVVVLVVAVRRWPSRDAWRVGLPIGIALAAGYFFQTEGLVSVKPGIAGLLTGLLVVFTPLYDRLLFRTRLRTKTVVSVVAALGGTFLLTGAGAGLSIGDLLVVVSALAFALQVVLLSHSGESTWSVGFIQMFVCAVVFLCLGTTSGVPYPKISGEVVFVLAVTGVLASALAILFQTWAQKKMSASRAGLLLAAEPALALGFAVVLTGERLDGVQLVGAVVLIGAILGHEIVFSKG